MTSFASHPALSSLRLISRRTQEHAGPCPFCGGDPRRSDRFRVWLQPGRERFWCRACNEKGPLSKLLGEERSPRPFRIPRIQTPRGSLPVPTHQEAYRELYATVALWAHALLLDECNPDPLAYLHARGLRDATIGRYVLGVTLRDPTALVGMLRREVPHLLAYGEEAGVLVRDQAGELRTHPNLCGCLVFPYMADGQIVDLRTRSIADKGYRSLTGGYTERGSTIPFGFEELGQVDTVIVTEGEIKALAVSQAYHEGLLDAPALAHPGLSYFREEWAELLLAQGVRTVILAYDSQPRPVRDGVLTLAPEEIWTLRHGQRLVDAGLNVRVLRLPLEVGEQKADLDAFLLAHSARRLQHLIDIAPTLVEYQRSLPRSLLKAADLLPQSNYPLRRARPQRLKGLAPSPAVTQQPRSLDEVRNSIETLVRDHALNGEGFLVLAHPPGTGKGHNTAAGLQGWIQAQVDPNRIVWTGLRKEQINDQAGITLTPLHGRNHANCGKLAEAQALSARGYNVRAALCQRRCPFVNSCTYLRQFAHTDDVFAAQDLLQATGWWEAAGVLVLDEFDPGRLVRTVQLDSADLARVSWASSCPYAQSIVRWLGMLLGDRTLTGHLLLSELEGLARAEQMDLSTTLQKACAALPSEDEIHMLRGMPSGASVADYATLPPNYLARIITQLDEEYRIVLTGRAFTSRLETGGGRLSLHLRLDHLIAQLARPDQPKLILDATANEGLLRAIFPQTPLRMERPVIVGGARVVQVITRDWAKSTLHGERRVRWYDEVASHIRPDRPTLVVCTQACEADLRAALHDRGHMNVVVAHYGAVRGSNAYKGYDVILAQVYHPNTDAVIREGRALFAGDDVPLDERMVTTERVLQDSSGERWVVQVPTFADARLAALLAHRREAELVQAALRGRPLDHPEAQITLLFGLPLESLPPTEVQEGTTSPQSNTGRQEQARATIARAIEQLLVEGKRVISVDDLVGATGMSGVTIRRHLLYLGGRLGLRLVQQRRLVFLRRGGQRVYRRMVLIQRGRRVGAAKQTEGIETNDGICSQAIDQARNRSRITCLIHRPLPLHGRPRTPSRHTEYDPVQVGASHLLLRSGKNACSIPNGDNDTECGIYATQACS